MYCLGQIFSTYFFIGSLCQLFAGFFSLISFASPYWSQSYPSTNNEFKNIGLWEVCFQRYRHWKDDNQKPYTGCFWFWSPDMIRFRDWIIPPWFVFVQICASLGFIFVFVSLALLSVSFLTSLRNRFSFILLISIISTFATISISMTLIVYGVYGDNREWMPRPEFNVYSWAYWFEMGAGLLVLLASTLFLAEVKELYVEKQKRKKIVRKLQMSNRLDDDDDDYLNGDYEIMEKFKSQQK